MNLKISSGVRAKLQGKRPPVVEEEIVQCFANKCGRYLTDTRENNKTTPPTKWFISETDFGRQLKIAFIFNDDHVIIKTAYDPNKIEMGIYERHG